jgi:hypothetical protein
MHSVFLVKSGVTVLGAVRDVGWRDPKPEKGPLHTVADRPACLSGDLSDLALHLL